MIRILREQWRSFWTAVMFLTRIPCLPFEYKEEYLHKASRFSPVVGWLVVVHAGRVGVVELAGLLNDERGAACVTIVSV